MMDVQGAVSNLVELLEQRAAERSQGTGFTFLVDGERQEAHLSFGDLHRNACAIAALLQSKVPAGARVVLLYPPGLDYISAFFGCLYGGFVAVPAYPPNPARLARTLPRLQAIVSDAEAEIVLTTSAIRSMTSALAALAPDLGTKTWLATDALGPELEAAWERPAIAPDTLAFLQYTSGSTGSPKGVMLTHRNLIANQEMISAVFGLSSRSTGVGWLPLYHDMGLIGNVLQPIYGGFRCILMSPLHFLARPTRWLEAISRYGGTASGGPNFAYDLCVRKIAHEERELLDLRTWEVAFTGAEPVRAETLDLFARTFAGCGFSRKAFLPCFGLAEASLLVSGKSTAGEVQVRRLDPRALEEGRAAPAAPSSPARSLVGAGPAAPGTRVVIVDPVTHRPQANGQVGEVWISGPHVAIGYWADREKTEATFGAQLADEPGARFLRSGDLAFLEDDEVYICGRLKDLIILRGRNYYPQDLEHTAEHAHGSLRRGCSAAFPVDVDGEEHLVVAVEVEPGSQSAADEIFAAIRRDIAASFEVHVHAIALLAAGSIPKTSSGKIQRRACRDMFLRGSLDVVRATRDAEGPELETDGALGDVRRAPEAQRLALVEDFVRTELARALRVRPAHVDMAAAVSGLGLDSLMAVEISHRVTKVLGVALPVAALLGDGSASELAVTIHAMLAASPEGEAASSPVASPAERAPLAADVFPVSVGQRSMWFLQQLEPDSAAYNLATALRLAGDFSPALLERALRQLIARHPALHTTYAEVDERPMQQLRPELIEAFALDVVDASTWSDAELDAHLRAEAARPFDLAAGPLLRASLFTRSAVDATLVLVAHHIATDLWSIVVLLGELRSAYPALRAGRDVAARVAAGASYREFVEWQRDYLATRGEADAAYWQAQIAGTSPLELPCDHRRPVIQSARGAAYRTRIEPALVAGITELARREGVTPFVILLAAFEVLLARWSGQSSFVVGTPVVGRPAAPFARVVGYFVNSLPLRADLSGAPGVRELLQRVRSTVLGALEHQHYPFMLTVQHSALPRDPSRSPVFQVMFVLERAFLEQEADTMMLVLGAADAPASFGGFELWPHPLPYTPAPYDLTLRIAQAGAEMAASFEYNADLFERETIERMAAQLAVVLRGLVAGPTDQVTDLLRDDERRRILHDWNDTAVAYPDARGLHELFEAQVERTPSAVAVRFGETAMSYAALSERSNQIAHHLIGLGIGRGARVAVSLPRSPELLASLLGVLKTGAAYLPLDPSYPRARVAFLLEDAAPAVLITERLDAVIPPGTLVVRPAAIAGAAGRLAIEVAPEDPAYLMYTSGSSGQPKAAIISHAALGNYLRWCVEAYDVARGTGAVVSTSVAFDATVTTLFPPLLVGRAVVMVPEDGDGHGDEVAALAALIASGEPLGPLKLTPAHIDMLRGSGVAPRPGQVHAIVVGGEQLLGEHVAWCRAAAPEARIFNEYGPTETTVGCSVYEVPPGPVPAVVPIGRPIANTRLYVLDAHLAPAPVGVTGELYIGGAGLAQGYHARPALTAERFVDDPFSPVQGTRMYRTGDLAVYLPDGNLRFLGRSDHQVKIRGFRIELAEIEQALMELPTVGAASVIVREARSGLKQLIGYVVPRPGGVMDRKVLRNALKERLPEYMVPSAFVVLDRLPLTPNGKVDRRSLPEPDGTELGNEYVAPRTPLEAALAD
ncbi:MAG TPA: amino acid adenylation domain-containing protein, partial [Kofleriaceae bacterium]|nr:amino acid adenylation domain-containing protein [Kofleriaceae bacterium]